MTDTKFTKGNWIAYYPREIINSGHVSVENDEGELICTSAVCKSNIEKRVANVNLISAAPDMYALLSEIADLDECQMLKGMINEVLAKARGDNND